MKNMKTLMSAAALLAMTGASQAALIDRGGGMIYDTTRNITWLADMNYALTSGYTGTGVNTTTGTMTWDAANIWADNLVYGGYEDWRLPTLNPADTTCSNSVTPSGFPTQYFGTGCTGGELSGLFVTDLGDTAEQIANLALFSNVQSGRYWSGTEYAPDPGGAWNFRSVDGSQGLVGKVSALYAVAVRPGDVTAAVPEPGTLGLLLAALGAGAMVRRRRSR